jgi:hypothetical protein
MVEAAIGCGVAVRVASGVKVGVTAGVAPHPVARIVKIRTTRTITKTFLFIILSL